MNDCVVFLCGGERHGEVHEILYYEPPSRLGFDSLEYREVPELTSRTQPMPNPFDPANYPFKHVRDEYKYTGQQTPDGQYIYLHDCRIER